MQVTKVKIQSGQTLFDISMRHYGSIEGVFQLASDNGITSITDLLPSGTELLIYLDKVINQELVNYYETEGISVCSSVYSEIQTLEGVGNWAIGIDFIIS